MAKPLVDQLDKHIARRLKSLRQQQGISAQALGEAIDSTQQQISRYENAHNKLSATQLYRIARVLGMPLSWFFVHYNDDRAIPSLAQSPAGCETLKTDEELAMVANYWQRLTGEQRRALLYLVEAFLK